MKKVECPVEKAEGDIHVPGLKEPVPYNTWSAGPDGCHLHIWLDIPYYGAETARKIKAFATNFRDIVSASYSEGEPTSYWAHQDMKA